MLVSERQSICIIGTGAQTAVGLSAPASTAAVRAGIAARGNHPFMVDQMGAPMVVCAVPNLGVDLDAVERFLQLALTPAREALAPVLQHSKARLQCSLFVALPEQRPGMPEHFENTFAEKFAIVLAKDINIQRLVVNSFGHAGGLYCMEQALSLLQSGKSQFCLIGGVDSYLDPETLEWLDALEQLHSETTIWGFCPGEGAGFCLLTSTDRAASLGLPIAMEIISAASAKEANPIKTQTVCIGQGLSEAFKKSLAHLPRDNQIDHTICDMNGEPYRGNEYGFAVLRSPGKFADEADFMTPADCWGDVGAASGPLFAILATSAANKGYAPGPHTFLWASSEGGLRATALLHSTSAKAQI